jgi:GT2 family glycosyltransferase
MQLSIIIVNFNVKYFLEHSLLSAIKASKNVEVEILVVDNNSTDGSKQYFEGRFPRVQFYWLKENLGFGKANNYALQYAKGEHILFLNPDTIVKEDCFTQCLSFFKEHNDCGAVGVRMIDGSGSFLKESKRAIPTAAAGFFRMTKLDEAFPNSKMFAKYYAGHLPEKENHNAEILAGAFMMLSKKAITITKGFDERFFMYGEDIDLSYRIIKAGMQNYYLGENVILHFKGESVKDKDKTYIDNFYGAVKRFVSIHYSGKPLKKIMMNAVIAMGKYIAKIKQLSKKDTSEKINDKKLLLVGEQMQAAIAVKMLENEQFDWFLLDDRNNKLSAGAIINFAKNTDTNQLLFCEGTLSNKVIIETVQLMPKDWTAYFYSAGAKSIICSKDKNETGFFITDY